MSIPFAVAEVAIAAARPARSFSDEAAITAGVEAALALDRRSSAHRLLNRLDELPHATAERAVVVAFVEELFTTADEIDHGAGRNALPRTCSVRGSTAPDAAGPNPPNAASAVFLPGGSRGRLIQAGSEPLADSLTA